MLSDTYAEGKLEGERHDALGSTRTGARRYRVLEPISDQALRPVRLISRIKPDLNFALYWAGGAQHQYSTTVCHFLTGRR